MVGTKRRGELLSRSRCVGIVLARGDEVIFSFLSFMPDFIQSHEFDTVNEVLRYSKLSND